MQTTLGHNTNTVVFIKRVDYWNSGVCDDLHVNFTFFIVFLQIKTCYVKSDMHFKSTVSQWMYTMTWTMAHLGMP